MSDIIAPLDYGKLKTVLQLLGVVLRDSTGLELSDYIKNLDVRIRYGRILSSLAWAYGSIASAPAAGTALASYSVPATKTGFIYGYFISASEANQFEIRWTSGGVPRAIRIVFGGGGTVHAASLIALNEGLPADPGTTITIVNINAGAAGSIYQAGLLIGIP